MLPLPPRPLLAALCGLLALSGPGLRAAEQAVAPGAPATWGDAAWLLRTDPATGALADLENRNDPEHMDWLRTAGHWEGRDWKGDTAPEARPLDGQWGLVTTPYTGLLHAATVRRLSERAWEATYTSAAVSVTVRREINAQGLLLESYTLRNTGVVDLDFPVGSVSISAPFFDQYPDTRESLQRRCHAHLWMGGSSAWVCAQRMGTAGPHLGLVLTQGTLEAYSQRGGTFNDRGTLLLHPGAMRLKRNETATVAWQLFWHQGWEDFFRQLAATPNFVRLTAREYVVTAGQPLEVMAETAGTLGTAKVTANGRPVPAHAEGDVLKVSIPTSQPGDLLVEVETGGRRSRLRAWVTPLPEDLLAARLKFIVRRQQCRAPGEPLDGAYVAFDNETGQQAYEPKRSDHNAGRERVGMGVLGALYLPRCRDAAFKAELGESLQRYSDFLTRELENDEGVVFSEVNRQKSGRIYNFPWVAHFHLALYRATGEARQLDRFVRVVRAYYATKGGRTFYPIGFPISDGLKALREAGRSAEYDELLAKFRQHADYLLQNGRNYPRAEVNYEQSIVAPGVAILAEMAVATGDQRYLEGAKAQMPLLEAFAGRQPDSRLYEIALRHWDDFWFGKIRTYGDTMPHYWSSLNALAYAWYGLASGEASWRPRAEAVVKGNLSLFTPEGAGSAAHLSAFNTNGQRGERNDPLANDQDWALVHFLMVQALPHP